jgi:voltage-gated potassium channel
MTMPPLNAPETRRQRILEDYEAKTSNLLSALALVYLLTFSAQAIFYDPKEAWYQWANTFGNVLWVLFAIDLAFRLTLSPRRLFFIKTHLIDVITVVVPQFRALRTLRAFSRDGILSKGKGAFTGRALATAAIATALIVWVGGLMVLEAERGAPGAEIVTFGDSIWWTFETITTVGYGDFVPVTVLGRFFATLIMIVGISVLGVLSGGLAASLVKQNPTPPTPAPADEVLKELADLKAMVASLQTQIARQDPVGT